ncbi:MAG: glycosyltransferase family 9 protein [Undibacterium sp.]|nr:glycosyltransferase family 9 protein [Opitutaceae bacterium]
MNVVLFKFNHLGDNLIFLPVVQTLRALRPGWKLTLLTTPDSVPLYTRDLPTPNLLTTPKLRFDKSWRRPWELAAWFARVRARRPDACLIGFDQANIAHLLARHSGARVRIGANLQHIRIAHSLTHETPMPAGARPADWNWVMGRDLLVALDGPAAARDWPATPPPPDLSHLIDRTGRSAPRRIVIHAGSSRPMTRWDPAQFATVAARLARTHEVVWIDRPETAGIPLDPSIRRVALHFLRDLVTLLADAALFLCNNSGPMHLANALGTPGVVVTGLTAPGWDPYWHRERWTVLRPAHPACAPCELPNKVVLTCANLEAPMACLRQWTPDLVEAACRARLALTP